MRHLIPFLSFALIPLLVSAPLNAQMIGNPGASGNSPESPDLQIRVIAGYTASAPVNSQAAAGFTVEVTTLDGMPVADAAVALRLPDTEPTGAFPDESHAMVAYTDQSGHARLAAVKWGNIPGLVAIRVTAVKGTAHAGVLVEERLSAAPVSSPAPEPRSLTPAPIASAVAPLSAAPVASIPAAQPVTAQPVTLTKPAAVESQVVNTPVAGHALTPAVAPLKPAPSVSVTNSAPASSQTHSSHKKWIIIAAIAAGAGAGIALAGHGKSGASTSQNSSLTIGAPTVSVGHP